MASQGHTRPPAASPDSLISVKVAIKGTNRKFKLPLRDLHIAIFNDRMRELLQVPANQTLILERFSDSSAAFVPVDIRTPSSYKQLFRAAKAKLKLRLRASLKEVSSQPNAQASSTTLVPTTPKAEEMPAEPKVHAAPAQAPTLPPLSQMLNGVADSGWTSFAAAASTPYTVPSPTSTSTEKASFSHPLVTPFWLVCCNKCDKQVTNEHYHCSICDGGDFDLCESCVSAGAVCDGEGHWMIKRTMKSGKFVSSTTEKIAPKPRRTASPKHSSMPGTFNTGVKPTTATEASERICNACIRHLPKRMLASCNECPDYDLCMACIVANKHGHHPGHSFTGDGPHSPTVQSLLAPGRNVRHHAICDNCEKTIFGVRYKCLDCPDFDFCDRCHGSQKSGHKHRFVPVYEPLDVPTIAKPRHIGIYCDGPLCNRKRNQSYIYGIRYKCAVCHDTDFCASCEAHPNNSHDKTHPMIMFKTMIKDVSIETINANPNGTVVSMGDRRKPSVFAPTMAGGMKDGCERALAYRPSVATLSHYTPKSAETLPAYSYHPGMPAPVAPMQDPSTKSIHPLSPPAVISATDMRAEFVCDTVRDGSHMQPTQVFTQTWTLENPGPHAWPSGCSVRHIGGDYMLTVDQNRPGSVADLALAQESNVTRCTVPPGQSFSFSIQMKAPPKLGKHISYWRLKSPDGIPFGHKLWCDIQVVAPQPPIAPAPQAGCSALADYQMQMMLLEQQNKRRLWYASIAEEERAQQQVPQASAPQDVALEDKFLRTVYRRKAALQTEQDRTAEAASKSVTEKRLAPGPVEEKAPEQAKIGSSKSEKDRSAEGTMVFPKLEKESPSSSLHEDAKHAPSAVVEAVVSPSVTTTSPTETDSAIGEVVSAKDEFESDSDDDDGFLTDDEYDILDASDEEIVNHGAF